MLNEGKKFVMFDNRQYFYDIECFDNCMVVKEGYNGFKVVENENSNDIAVYFKDLQYDDDVERFFVTKKENIKEILNKYNFYSKNPYEKYQKLLSLKKTVVDEQSLNFIFYNNYTFFISINLSFNEWKGFNGYFNKRQVS